MATLNALKKAIVNGPDGASLLNTHANVVSSDANIVAVQLTGNGEFFAAWAAPGTATLTATRLADGVTATLDVTALPASPFSISLGDEVPL
jgi:hypothetical protein